MSEEDKEVIKVDGVEYELDSFSDKARHLLRQIQQCTAKTAQLQNKMQHSEVARIGFVNLLKEELEATPEEVEEAAEVSDE
tara:strand:- start:256 stop:498 length:243 start_codon:yes stop_codon:yes gene_type:complete